MHPFVPALWVMPLTTKGSKINIAATVVLIHAHATVFQIKGKKNDIIWLRA
jgi:hypothetical protein